MSKKPFDYSKWDNIELSDDEDDVHPNIDKESWFRMRHRSRVEREDNESKDIANIQNEINKANERIAVLQYELQRLDKIKQESKTENGDDDDDDDEDLDAVEKEGYMIELKQLQSLNEQRQNKLKEYEKNKKWNVDNMFTMKEERTIVNPNAAKPSYNPSSGYVEHPLSSSTETTKPAATDSTTVTQTKATSKSPKTSTATTKDKSNSADAANTAAAVPVGPKPPPSSSSSSGKVHNVPDTKDLGAMATYHEFTEKYADVVEGFMKCATLDESKEYLLQYGNIVLCENASNYLLLASLEDEMNGYRDKMKLTARQSQIVSNIAELAKTIQQHPGNVIQPFFHRLSERKHLEEFLYGVNVFVEKIIQRAVVKRAEIDEQRRRQPHNHNDDDDDDVDHDAHNGDASTSLHDVPREQRLGPGGLDPLEVIETLPECIVAAFESRDVEQLKTALLSLSNEDAEYHMQRCIDSGLWVANANANE